MKFISCNERSVPTATLHLIYRRRNGFALIATIMLMILLMVLCVGMLSLSTVTLRSRSTGLAQAEAEANARMALMIAIGELQEHAGPDQRITATASILSDPNQAIDPAIYHPHWTGIWDSWKASDPLTSGGDELSQHATLNSSGIGMHPEYSPNKSSHFRAWLASLPEGKASEIAAVRDLTLNATLMPSAGDAAVKLVAQGSIGETGDIADHVSVALIDVKSGPRNGRYGWWVGDESVKASIMADAHDKSALSVADGIFRHQSPGSTGTAKAAGMENVAITANFDPPSLKTLDLHVGADQPSMRSFHDITLATSGVLADVREGGLKRDLSVLLEQPIRTTDNGKDHMLYSFADGIKESVPIQDLSAYYQLYQNDPTGTQGRKGGIMYGSPTLPGAIQVEAPDYGDRTTREKVVREYTTLYRNPVPIKIQYVFALTAVPLDPTEIIPSQQPSHDPAHTHRLVPGVMPIVTLWNPNNVPLVMGGSPAKSQVLNMGCPPFNLRWTVYREDGTTQQDNAFNMNAAINVETQVDGRGNINKPNILNLRIGANEAITFEPGETKIFTIPDTNKTNLLLSESSNVTAVTMFGHKQHDAVNAYNPYGFYTCFRSCAGQVWNGKRFAYQFLTDDTYTPAAFIGAGVGDSITWSLDTERRPDAGSGRGTHSNYLNETFGAGFQFYLIDNDNCSPANTKGSKRSDHIRHYQFMSRFGGRSGPGTDDLITDFNTALMQRGFEGGVAPIPPETKANAFSIQSMVDLATRGEAVPVALFTLSAGCEAHESSTAGYAAGRRVSTRPFLHGSTIAAPFIDSFETEDLYDYGWDWSVERITTLEQVIQVEPGTGRNYYGGGYTSEKGTTHVIQQEIPVLPPISIAALSHAHLGGFSLADRPVTAEVDDNFRFDQWWAPTSENRDPDPNGDSFRRVTAMGQGGLAPHVMQAIGNSYAHPNIPADKAFIEVGRIFDNDVGPENRIFADHSYLANKALWDEYFFSSIIPKLSSTPLYGENLTAQVVAEQFFFDNKPLPNRRMIAYKNELDSVALGKLFLEKDTFSGGLADKIAAHLLVQGAFNINSTSVEAWKVILSSLRGKPVQYLAKNGNTPTQVTPVGTPVGFGSLPNGAPIDGSLTANPNDPAPWTSWRELTDTEVDELAVAIVKQVKLRGPFLSLSEFVNRRLDTNNRDLSVKGALQAALDDPAVSINKPFWEPDRIMDNEPDVTSATYEFEEAAKGPIAYGSSAYVDQADVLRNFAGILTPRGDTFVIRTYGDSLSPDGKVLARAWCEAVVQRVPDYLDSADPNETKQADLTSPANIRFGRKFKLISFRWLNPLEV